MRSTWRLVSGRKYTVLVKRRPIHFHFQLWLNVLCVSHSGSEMWGLKRGISNEFEVNWKVKKLFSMYNLEERNCDFETLWIALSFDCSSCSRSLGFGPYRACFVLFFWGYCYRWGCEFFYAIICFSWWCWPRIVSASEQWCACIQSQCSSFCDSCRQWSG